MNRIDNAIKVEDISNEKDRCQNIHVMKYQWADGEIAYNVQSPGTDDWTDSIELVDCIVQDIEMH